MIEESVEDGCSVDFATSTANGILPEGRQVEGLSRGVHVLSSNLKLSSSLWDTDLES